MNKKELKQEIDNIWHVLGKEDIGERASNNLRVRALERYLGISFVVAPDEYLEDLKYKYINKVKK